MQIQIIPVTPYQQNCSVVKCNASGKAAIVDPGGEAPRILALIGEMNATLEKVILTHAHLDHCAAADIIRQQTGVPIEGPHKDDEFWLDRLPEWCRMSGFPPVSPYTPDRWLQDGDEVRVGTLKLEVLHCPGHTPGHVVFYHRAEKLAWVGDVLFQGSIGRTDFPRGNHAELINSIRQKLFPLGNDVRFIPGHGPSSTFGQERRTNAFVADHVVAGDSHQ
jgi:glyoxylase-like metal-dependent hydrolase (beta-lactamase superfamily II)